MTARLLSILAILLCPATSVLGGPDKTRYTSEIAALIDGAEPGATVLVPAGVYHGSLTITKPITLDGQGSAVIDGLGEGTVVTLSVPEITLRGFTVRHSASKVDREPAGIRAEAGPVVIEDNRLEDVLFGIDLRPSPGSTVRRNTVIGMPLKPGRRGDGIRLWWSHASIVEDNVVRGSRDMVFWYSEDLTIQRNDVRDSRYGLHFMYSHNTTLRHNTLMRNSVGIYLMYSNNITLRNNTLAENRGPSGYGLGLKDCDNITVTDNHLTANRVGIYVDNTPSSVDADALLERNMIAFNQLGMLVTPNTKRARVLRNGFVENEEQVAVHGRGDLEGNAFSQDGRGNFWSNYTGFDRNGDSIGDFPYEAVSLFEDLLAREPNLRLFVQSPAQQAVEFTARALPEVRPRPKFIDPHPLMRPPSIERSTSTAGTSRPAMFVVAASLLVFGVGAVRLGARHTALHTRHRSPVMIRASGVTKRFGRVTAVSALTFSIEPGQSVALWGSNGAGKTTLIRCILGILRFKGSITVGGANARTQGKLVRRMIGYVPQELSFHDDMRLADAIGFFAALRAVPRSRARHLIDRVGLAGHERKRVRDLSGGMKQRFALAVALLADPPIIVLDEPTSNLDALARHEVVEMLQTLKKDSKTILFASHRPDEVVALADRILVMEHAALLRDATPSELWPAETGVKTVRLHVTAGTESHAAALLRDAGHTVNLNGHGLCVAVPRDRKAAPLQILANANVDVRDFEILEDLQAEGTNL